MQHHVGAAGNARARSGASARTARDRSAAHRSDRCDRRAREPLRRPRSARDRGKDPRRGSRPQGTRRLERQRGACHVRVVFAVDVGRDRLEAGEADERQDLAQPVELDHAVESGDPRRARRQTASGRRRAWKFGIDRDVVAVAFWCREQRVELHLLDRAVAGPAVLTRSIASSTSSSLSPASPVATSGLLLDEASAARRRRRRSAGTSHSALDGRSRLAAPASGSEIALMHLGEVGVAAVRISRRSRSPQGSSAWRAEPGP